MLDPADLRVAIPTPRKVSLSTSVEPVAVARMPATGHSTPPPRAVAGPHPAAERPGSDELARLRKRVEQQEHALAVMAEAIAALRDGSLALRQENRELRSEVSFGSYATSLFVGDDAGAIWDNVFTSALIVVMVTVNLVGARFVAKAQSLIVAGVLGVFAVFICVTIPNISTDLLAPGDYPSLSKIIASVALTFFAYLGFNVITFAAGDMSDPKHDLPRAMYLALGITGLVYVLIALGVFGALTVQEVIGYGETAIAEAARPTLGDAGFTVMAVAALLSTAGATNATLYASGNLTGMLAEEGLFPQSFGSGSRLGQHAGLLITAGLVLVTANLVDLSAIASVGSAVALMVFLLVAASGWRRRADTGSKPAVIIAAFVMTAVVLGFFAIDTLQTAPATFIAIIALGVLSVALDAIVRHRHRPTPAPRPPAGRPVASS